MKVMETPEMKDYLDVLENNREFAVLFKVECTALAKLDSKPGNDWADIAGADILQQYWLAADDPEQQAKLGHISHLRARAWDAIWEFCMPFGPGYIHYIGNHTPPCSSTSRHLE